MADSMIQNLLKTPRQIREEQLQKMRDEAAGRAQLGGPIRGASSALPGIFSSVLQQQRPALATDIAQTARGLTQGLGGMLGAAGYQQAGQALAQATVTPEERQATQAQSVMRGLDMNDPAALKAAANELMRLGLTGAATQLSNRANSLVDRLRQQGFESSQEARAAAAESRKVAEEQRTEAQAQKESAVDAIKATVPFDATDLVKYYTDQAEALSKAGFNVEADEAITKALEAREGSSDTAAIKNFRAYKDLSESEKIEYQLANGRVLDPETAQALEQAKSQGRVTGREVATRLMSFDERISTTDQMLSVVEELTNMEGFESAVGLSANLPTFRPSTADFEIKLEQLKGQAFLEQFSKLKGAGAITEKEGTAAAAALTALSSDRALKMSEEQFLKELKTLQTVIKAAQERAKKGVVAADWGPKDSYVPPTEVKTTTRRRFNPDTNQFEEVES
jgi:polyhydroxyalkanoate synthesis regulator phasin